MRLAFFTPQYMEIGGVENVIREIASRLSKQHEVFLITRERKVNTDKFEKFWSDVYVIKGTERFSNFVKKRKEVEEYVKAHKIDVVNFHNWSVAFPFIFSKFKKVLTMHGSFTETLLNRKDPRALAAWIAEEIAMNSADAVVSITKHHMRLFAVWRPVHVIYNGVDAEFFSRKKVRARRHDRFTGLFVGKFMPAKGLRYLVEIARLLPDIDFIVAGDGEERFFLDSAPENVKWVGMVRDKKKLRELYASADFSILPSINEGLPLALLEAMAMELPIVCSRAGGMPEIVEKAGCGFVVRSRDVEGFVNAVRDLQNDREKQELFGKKGREFVERELGWERVVEKYQNVFEKSI